MNGFPKAAEVDNFSQIFLITCLQRLLETHSKAFRDPSVTGLETF
jgi:hypothetical protein